MTCRNLTNYDGDFASALNPAALAEAAAARTIATTCPVLICKVHPLAETSMETSQAVPCKVSSNRANEEGLHIYGTQVSVLQSRQPSSNACNAYRGGEQCIDTLGWLHIQTCNCHVDWQACRVSTLGLEAVMATYATMSSCQAAPIDLRCRTQCNLAGKRADRCCGQETEHTHHLPCI